MAVTPLGAAAIGAGLSTLGGAFTSMLNHSAQRDAEERSFQRSLALMEAQNKFNVNMWERTNAYDAPSNQLKLMKQAGINPALFDMRGQNPASEVTSADASIPYNSRAGSEYDALGLGRIGDNALQALQVDAQMAKLRTEIKYQELVNRDLQNELDAKEELMDSPASLIPQDDRSPVGDTSGNGGLENTVTVTAWPKYNAYKEKRLNERISSVRNAIGQSREFDEYRGFLEDYPFLRGMTQKQLTALSEDIRSKQFSNQMLEEDVRMMKTYGISSQDKNEWTALLRAALHDPDNISRILQALGDASSRTFTNLIESFGRGTSHRNPSSGAGSW